MTSSVEQNASLDHLRDDSITPEYDKLANEYATLTAQVDAVDTDLTSKFPVLLSNITKELAQFSTAEEWASYEQVIAALQTDLSLEDQNYVALLKRLYATTLWLQQEYVTVQAIRNKETTDYTTKIAVEAGSENTSVKNRLQQVDTKQYTTITIPWKKKRDKPTEKSAFEVELDPSVVARLVTAERELETAKQGLFVAQSALERNRLDIVSLADRISIVEATIQNKTTEVGLNDISMRNNADTKNSGEVQRLSGLNEQLKQQIVSLQTELDGANWLRQQLAGEQWKTKWLEDGVTTAHDMLIDKQALYAQAFEAQQQAYNTAVQEKLSNIQGQIVQPVSILKVNIQQSNQAIAESWAEVQRLQSSWTAEAYAQIAAQARSADAAEKQRTQYVADLVSKLDMDYAVKISFIDYRRKWLDTELRRLWWNDGTWWLIGGEVVQQTTIDGNIQRLQSEIQKAQGEIQANKSPNIPVWTPSGDAAKIRKQHAEQQANRLAELGKLERALEVEQAKKQTVDGRLQTIQAEYNRTLANRNYLEAAQQLIVAQYRNRTAELAFQQEVYAHRQEVLRVRSAQEQRAVLLESIQTEEKKAIALEDKTDATSLWQAKAINDWIIALSDKVAEVWLVADRVVTLASIDEKRTALALSNKYLAEKAKQFKDATADADRTFTLPADLTTELDLDYTALFWTEEQKD